MKKNRFIMVMLLSLITFSGCNENITSSEYISSSSSSENISSEIVTTTSSSSFSSSSSSLSDSLIHDNGIEAILKSFSKEKVYEEEVEDSIVNANVKFYTFNRLEKDNSTNPVALYVINHNESRVGTEFDVDIINDLLNEYIVIVLDYQKATKAVSPFLEESANTHKISIMNQGLYLNGLSFNNKCTYLIPEGCRIKRNIEFFNIMKHAPKGVIEKTIDIWNKQEQVKNRVGESWKEAATLDDIVMKNGESLLTKNENGEYKYLGYRLDIVYPSQPNIEVPVVMYASSNVIRNTALSSVLDRFQFAGFMFRWYSLVSYDHDYFPFMKDEEGWGHIEPNYTLQSYMGTRLNTAALRCVKYYAQELGYSNTNIGVYGHSKASWVALFKQKSLENIDPENLEEIYTYGNYKPGECFGEQPFKTYKDGGNISSNVKCVYHSMGNGTNDCRYLSEDNIPQMVGVGEKCQYNSWKKFFKTEEVYKKLNDSGCDFVPLIMYDVGHTYPPNKSDKMYGYNYYEAYKAFFDHHLKGMPAKLLHTSVKNDGTIADNEEIFIQFSAKVDETSIIDALRIIDSNGKKVEGVWNSSRGGNKFSFIPNSPLVLENDYKIEVDSTIKDTKNNFVEGIEKEFRYVEGPKEENLYNSLIAGQILEDTYIGSNSTSAKAADYSQRSTLGTYSNYYRSYFKFNFKDILSNPDFATYKENGKIQFKFSVAIGESSISSGTKFTFKGFTPQEGVSNADFSKVYWNNVLSTGEYPKLHWNEGDYILNGEVQGENISYINSVLTFTFNCNQIEQYIDSESGNAVFVLMVPGTGGISLASMENLDFNKPSVQFSYNK